MAPEQVRAAPSMIARSLCVGAVLYEMLGGRRAFQGDSPVEMMNAILKEEPTVFRNRRRFPGHWIILSPMPGETTAISVSIGDPSGVALDTERSPSVPRAGARRPDASVAMGRWRGALVVIAIAVLALVAGAAIDRLVAARWSPAAAAMFKRLTFEHARLRRRASLTTATSSTAPPGADSR